MSGRKSAGRMEPPTAGRGKGGIDVVVNALRSRARSLRTNGKERLTVGYSAPYAVYVHENLEAHHTVGEAKFLEKPNRSERDKIAAIIRDELKAKKTMVAAQRKAGQHLLRVSKTLVPVDTGVLKASGFVKVGG